jgi:hypothetical protein
MLFDLQGKRKNFIRVVYATLALLMGGGLVLLGIGGDANGGLLDAVGLGSNSTQQSDPAYDDQIERLEEDLAANPEDQKALVSLAKIQYLAGNSATEVDEETGETALSEESISRYVEAIDSWEAYLATKPKDPDDGVATLMVQAYAATGGNELSLGDAVEGGLEASQIVADARPSLGTYTTLAQWAYLARDSKLAEEAKKKALAEATDSTGRQQVNQQLKAAEAQGKAIAKAEKESAADPSELEDPTAGLGGTAPALPGGTAPVAPGG